MQSVRHNNTGCISSSRAREANHFRHGRVFAFYGAGDAKITGGDETERVSSVPVTQKFFPLAADRGLVVLCIALTVGPPERGPNLEFGPAAIGVSSGLAALQFALPCPREPTPRDRHARRGEISHSVNLTFCTKEPSLRRRNPWALFAASLNSPTMSPWAMIPEGAVAGRARAADAGPSQELLALWSVQRLEGRTWTVDLHDQY